MEIRKRELYTLVKTIKSVLDRRPALPILSAILLAIESGRLVATGTDGNVWLRHSIPAAGSLRALVRADTLVDLLKPSSRSDAETLVSFSRVDSRKLCLTAGSQVAYLETIPDQDFPRWPAGGPGTPEARWPVEHFKSAMSFVVPAISRDETRCGQTGVYFDATRAATTDGHRLHLAALAGLSSGPVLIPTKAIETLQAALPYAGELTVTSDAGWLVFKAGDLELAARPKSERFPPYEQVIPTGEEFHVVADQAVLTAALKHMPRSVLGVRLVINGAMEVSAEVDGTSTRVRVPFLESTHRGRDLEIGVSPRYLAEVIAHSEPRTTLRFGGALDPIGVEPGDDRFALIMPIRL
jgi:DNA polymerase III sliding clamp (beta) subunit (PCNA family)